MTDLIGRLVTWVSLLLNPRGSHRRTGARLAVRTAPHQQATTSVIPLPSHRSPYGLPTPLDGAATVAVRPYVAASPLFAWEAAA
ncbi:hypothetical protein [Streptomyces sp. E2N166]|uniref:hypothetical protein n=1 Tax=Streptomyces sp. E2N166 TaxID=1851909 RepID=UPI000EF67DE1|nr:hypothetical protein [Streptomyces sp. E2N166]